MRFLMMIFMACAFLFGDTIKIAVAANVSYAIKDIVKEFKKDYPNVKVEIIFGSSGNLTAQIKNGAPYDLFLSANMKYPYYLFSQGLALSRPEVYAKGELILFGKKKRDMSNIIKLLNSKEIKSIALANPKTAPYGKAAKEALESMKIYNKVKNKLIFAQSISQNVVYVLKAADIGFISKSAMFAKVMKRYNSKDNYVMIDNSLYSPLEQGVVLLKNAKNSKEAKDFYEFIFSKKVKNILKKYGYIVK